MRRVVILALSAVLAVLALPGRATAGATAAAPLAGRIAYSLGPVVPDPDLTGTSRVFTVHPDGSHLRQLTHLTAPDQAGDPNFSPNGKRLLYVSNAGGSPFQVWTMGVGGAGQRRLLDDPEYDAFLPRWSPDGVNFVFTRCRFVFGALECAIASAHIDWTHLKVITGGHNVDFSATYAPHDGYVVFDSNRNNSVSAIWRTTGAWPGPRRLTSPAPEAFWPDVSPDDHRILFTDNFGRPGSSQHSMRADGTDDRTLAPGCFGGWSPDGSRIAYDGG